ncbi:hypothetical protein ACOMHN_041219 [Nucella lapillus]
MKYCVSLRWVFSVMGLVLINVQTGWMRPASSGAGYSPPLNCSTPPDWGSPSGGRPRTPPEDFNNVDFAEEVEDISVTRRSSPSGHSDPTPPQYNYLNSSPQTTIPDFYYLEKGPEYFDYYYYEDSALTDEGVDEGQTIQYQPPPGLHNRVAKLKLMKTPRRQPPEYMLELYDRLSRAKPPLTTRSPSKEEEEEAQEEPDLTTADIVRSFPNINKEGEYSVTASLFLSLSYINKEGKYSVAASLILSLSNINKEAQNGVEERQTVRPDKYI